MPQSQGLSEGPVHTAGGQNSTTSKRCIKPEVQEVRHNELSDYRDPSGKGPEIEKVIHRSMAAISRPTRIGLRPLFLDVVNL